MKFLNPFIACNNYPEMLNKISMFDFFIILVELFILKTKIPEVKSLLGCYSLKIPVEGIPISIGYFVIPLVITFVFRVFKLHDRISDLFKIRYNFDINHILKPMISKIGIKLSEKQEKDIKTKRREIMSKVFYEYTSSTPNKCLIDPHYVTMALDQWTWFWITIEAQVITLLMGVVFIIYKHWTWSVMIVFVVLIVLLMQKEILHQCIRYAGDEINEILKDKGRENEIKNKFNAI
jgi:hypothetical protein